MPTEKLSQKELEAYLADTDWESEWRTEADLAAAYYDGNQLTADVVQQMRERGLAPLIRNLVGPTVDLVLGIEAKSKRDFRVRAVMDDAVEVATAMSAQLNKAERVSDADQACSEAYASMVKTGVGWVEVARETDPFRAAYRVREVSRREVYWDFRAKEDDLSDARYLMRKQWIDEDIAILHFPKHAELIRNAMRLWADWDETASRDEGVDLVGSREQELRSSLESEEWRDTDRRRVCLYEVWYRHWRTAPILTLPSGRTVEYDDANPAHVQAVAMGMGQIRKAVFPKVRLSWWAGPHLLADVPSPYPHNRFPYVPFWGYREDQTGAPYGLVRRMMSPQDEINARLSKMMWLLSAKRVIGDSDAVDQPWAEVVEEASRPDAVILMNPNRKNKNADALRVESDFALSQQQFNVLQDATRAIQDAAGVYQSMLGKSEHSGQSGAAISSLVEQGSTTLAELNDNYRSARKLVGTLLLSLVQEDIGTAPYTVTIESNGQRSVVELNTPTTDAEGRVYLTNDVAQTQMVVELEDVPDTPGFRAQQLVMLTEITKSLPPQLQPVLADFMLRATDLPFRHEAAGRIAKFLGLGDPASAEGQAVDPVQAQQQQMAQMQAEAAQQQMQLQLAEMSAKLAKAEAEAKNAQLRGQELLNKAAGDAALTNAKLQAMQLQTTQNMDKHATSQDVAALDMVNRMQKAGENP